VLPAAVLNSIKDFMTINQVMEIFDAILRISAALVGQNRDSIGNERYFHHMFSFLAAQQLGGNACWDELRLRPEYPTTQRFCRKKINVYDPRSTAVEGVGTGRKGNLDFVIEGSPRTLVEWKGPTIYSEKEILEALLKLLTEPEQDVKVIAAVFTTSETDRNDHRKTIKNRFQNCLTIALQVLQEKSLTADLATLNLHAYMASIPRNGLQKIYWGPVTADLVLQ